MSVRVGRTTWVMVIAAGLLMGACGDDGASEEDEPQAGMGPGPDNPSPISPDPVSPDPEPPGPNAGDGLQVCYDLCQAQDTAEMAGNCVALGLSACQGICDAAEGGGCWDKLVALNRCQLTGEFSCGFFSAESDADCDAELQAYNACFGF